MPRMRQTLSTILLSLLCAYIPSSNGHSGEIRYQYTDELHPHTNTHVGTIQLTGDIERGDSDKIEEIVQNGRNNNILFREISLFSPGGLASEGILIGRLVRKLRLATSAPYRIGGKYSCHSKFGDPVDSRDTNCVCASACALAWLGGVERTGTVGVHRSYMLRQIKEADYGVMNNLLGISHSEILSYLHDMRLPNWVADSIMKTSSSEILFLDDVENGVLFREMVFSEYIYSRCGENISDDERQLLSELNSKRLEIVDLGMYRTKYVKNNSLLTTMEKAALESLERWRNSYAQCTTEAHLDAIHSLEFN